MATGVQITSGGAIQITPGPLVKIIDVCPSDDTLIATFENIGVDICAGDPLCVIDKFCECNGTPTLKWWTFTDISINGAFELTKTLDTGDIKQWEGSGGDLHIAKHNLAFCVDPIVEECDCIDVSRIVVQCLTQNVEPLRFRSILYYIPFFDVCAPSWGSLDMLIFHNSPDFIFGGAQFLEGPIDYGVPDDNSITCVTSGIGGFGAATGGTVTFARG